MIDYARKLQSSESVQNSYIGIYSETNAYKELGSPETKQKYEETIKYFRNSMIKKSKRYGGRDIPYSVLYGYWSVR